MGGAIIIFTIVYFVFIKKDDQRTEEPHEVVPQSSIQLSNSKEAVEEKPADKKNENNETKPNLEEGENSSNINNKETNENVIKNENNSQELKLINVKPDTVSNTIQENHKSGNAYKSTDQLSNQKDEKKTIFEEVGILSETNPFATEHNIWMKIFLKGLNNPISESDISQLNAQFIMAKSKYDENINSEWKNIYSKEKFELSRIGFYFFIQICKKYINEIYDGVKVNEISAVKDAYRFSLCLRHFNDNSIFASFKLNDYESEKEEFSKEFKTEFGQAYYFREYVREKFMDLMMDEFVKPSVDKEKIQSILESFNKFGYYQKKDYVVYTSISVRLEDVFDFETATQYFLDFMLNSFIKLYISGKNDEAELEFAKLKRHYSDISSISEFVSEYYSSEKIMGNSALLAGDSRPLVNNLYCSTNSIYQCLVNFYPLLQKLKILEERSVALSDTAKAYAKALKEISKHDKNSFDPSTLVHTIRENPLSPLLKIFKAFPLKGAYFNKFCGILGINGYYPPNLFYILSDLEKDKFETITVIGEVFIVNYYNYNLESHNKPLFDVPESLNLKVFGNSARKQFSLVSFVHGKSSNCHAVAYVKRANGKWYLCDSLHTVHPEVNKADIPITKAAQAKFHSGDRPYIGFYLRIEE